MPEMTRKQEEWVTDELCNLSRKKKDAWLHLCEAGRQPGCSDSLNSEYQHLCKLTKVAADKARSARSARAVEAERRAWVAEQSGHAWWITH